MSEHSTKWWDAMISKHGSREAVQDFMRAAQQKSMLNPKRQKGQHHGGFSDPEVARRAGQKSKRTK